jgi:hypothetical protein
MGPRGFWIALAIVLFHLIARPHVGTVWYVSADSALSPTARPTVNPSDPFGAETAPTLPPGLTPIVAPSPPSMRFTDKRDCYGAAMRYESSANVTGAFCVSMYALLWGW